MKELALINPENASEEEVLSYAVREAARAVVVDGDGNIAMLHVSNEGYYKLPGGGLEDSEDQITALKRECQEEIGCDIEVIGEVGSIVEYRKIFNLKQISYCYLARLKGAKGSPHFEKDELEDGFKELWLPYDDALRAISESKTTNFRGSAYMVPRDTLFLMEAGEYLKIKPKAAVL